jgi:uncharacterized protein (TIGR03435 family)
MRYLLLLSLIAVAAFAGRLSAQAPAAQTPQFEAASIKRNRSDEGAYLPGRLKGQTFFATNVPVEELIRVAHGVPSRDIIGPSWIYDAARERYDVTARAADGSSPQDQRAMLQHMLATRFGLRLHRETRELPVHLLQTLNENGELGPNLKRAAMDCAPPAVCADSVISAGYARGKGRQWPDVFRTIAFAVTDRRVIDRTGLSGAFDFELSYARSLSATDGPAADIFTALRQQLGLKLESARAPFEVTVVDSVSRPTPD